MLCFSECLRIVMSNILSYHMSLRSEFRVAMSATISPSNDVRYVFTSNCLSEGSCIIMCFLRIVVPNTY